MARVTISTPDGKTRKIESIVERYYDHDTLVAETSTGEILIIGYVGFCLFGSKGLIDSWLKPQIPFGPLPKPTKEWGLGPLPHSHDNAIVRRAAAHVATGISLNEANRLARREHKYYHFDQVVARIAQHTETVSTKRGR